MDFFHTFILSEKTRFGYPFVLPYLVFFVGVFCNAPNLEGDSGPPRDGREPSWARPCEASGALLLSNGGTGGGHAACTLWPPPAPFGYFPARGKYLVRPQADETSHKK